MEKIEHTTDFESEFFMISLKCATLPGESEAIPELITAMGH